VSLQSDYYYFKTNGYSIVVQLIIDYNKIITYVFVSLLGLVNDSQILQRSYLYIHAQYKKNQNANRGTLNGYFPPCLVGDKGYPLISWIMTLLKKKGQHFILELLYNKKHKHGRFIIENAFGILKKTYKKLLGKFELNVTFILYMFIYACILHNLLRSKGESHIERLMHIINLKSQENLHQAQQMPKMGNQQVHHGIEGQERSIHQLHQELTMYFGHQ
jgi:hypothetical protein